MKDRVVLLVLLCCLACCFVSARDTQAAAKMELIGKTSINWNLVSSEGKLVNYGPEYYDKYYLILTFFPAAYTPV